MWRSRSVRLPVQLAGRLVRVIAILILALHAGPISPGELETLVMPGKVIKGHADIESDCRKCHVPFRKDKQARLCLDCHEEVAGDISKARGYHGRLKLEIVCSDCHSEHKGRRADIVGLQIATFDHSLTDYVLLGLHTKTKCGACHTGGKKYREAPTTCVACHLSDDVHKAKLGATCDDCHTEAGWKLGKFDHSRTRFPLRQSHGAVPCRDCHKSPTFHDRPSRACVGCHQRDDVHKNAFGKKCESCHSESKWTRVHFDHERDAHFALRQAHASIKCSSCHKAPLYTRKLPATCVGCHQKDDVHKGSLGADCKNCHTESDWKKVIFNHDRDTKFKLHGAHEKADCSGCHTNKLTGKKPPNTCNGCHSRDDVHRGGLGTACQSCHIEASWLTTRFDHAKQTGYPLLGGHAKASCKSCHADKTFRQKLSKDCASCHMKDDVHEGQQGNRCESCHTEKSWKAARFDHSVARFPLTGRHLKVACGDCHQTPRFKDAPQACVSCHRKDDAHKGRLGGTCNTCHNTRDWRIWDFDHHKETGFVIDGAHGKLACVSCHSRPGEKVYTAGGRCIDCHDRDDVHHGGFGNQCGRCHLTSNFRELRSGVATRPR